MLPLVGVFPVTAILASADSRALAVCGSAMACFFHGDP